MRAVRDITRKRGDVCYRGKLVAHCPKTVGVPAGEDQIPATRGEASGQREAETPCRPRDEGGSSIVLHVHSLASGKGIQ
jgi:hypothetical protein